MEIGESLNNFDTTHLEIAIVKYSVINPHEYISKNPVKFRTHNL